MCTLHRDSSDCIIVTITDVQALITGVNAHALWAIETRVCSIAVHVSFRTRASEGSDHFCSVQCEKKKGRKIDNKNESKKIIQE